MLRDWFRALAAMVALSASVAHAQGTPPPLDPRGWDAAFEEKLDAAFATGDFVGLSVAVVRGERVSLLKTYGVRQTGGGDAVTPSTVFRVASLSKGFASTLAALAMEEGRLAPADPVARFAPRLALAGGAHKALTLDHVLSHRTGLPPNAYDNLLEDGAAPADIQARYPAVRLICPVGACYAYQNILYDVVGDALSSAYGKPYGVLLGERLFRPLGMTTASVGVEGLAATVDHALPHKRERLSSKPLVFGPWRTIEVKDAYYRTPAAGGVNASILDMAAWLKAQMGARPDVLPLQTLALIHTPKVATPSETARVRQASTRYSQTQYGYGWRIYAYEGRPLVTHSGTVDGYAAQIAFLPGRDVGIVLLSNARSRRFWRILPTFLDLELGLPREDWLELEKSGAAAFGMH